MLYTLSHELTHYIKEWSPAKFQSLANFLMEQYGKQGQSVDELVQAQIRKAKSNGRTIDYDTAYDEVIADSMESMLTDGKVIEKLQQLYKQDKTLFEKISDFINKWVDKVKQIYSRYSPNSKEGKLVLEMKDSLEELQSKFAEAIYAASENATDSSKESDSTTQNPTSDADVRYSAREIVGEDGTNYGLGVYLDSQELAVLSEEERENAVKNHIKKLSGHLFSAFDNDGNEVKIKVAPNTRYETQKGSRERANRHLTNFLVNKEKQESLMLIDEIIGSATFIEKESATKAHGWLDNNGKNEWDVWTAYIQDKENTIWVAKLKIANTTNGEKVLYDVHPIEKVGQGRTLPTIPTKNKIPQDITKSQEKLSDRDYSFDPELVADLQADADKLKSDVANLKELLKLQRIVTHGTVFTKTSVNAAASKLMKTFGMNRGKVELASALNEFYRFL